jgi:hypothetical protein
MANYGDNIPSPLGGGGEGLSKIKSDYAIMLFEEEILKTERERKRGAYGRKRKMEESYADADPDPNTARQY